MNGNNDNDAKTQLATFETWLTQVTESGWTWYVKRLSANDTLATHAHQAGPYVPKPTMFRLFPTIEAGGSNPEALVRCVTDSHNIPERTVRAIWYNEGTRNETRITRWGGAASPILDPDSTGSVCILAFRGEANRDAEFCRAWLCDLSEEQLLIEHLGPVEPGQPLMVTGGVRVERAESATESNACWLEREQIPPQWLDAFPSAWDIVGKSVELRDVRTRNADTRLQKRRICEYEVFRSVESAWVLPQIRHGFDSVDDFVSYGLSVSNRRKSRAGWSLELQTHEILREEGVPFSHGETTEGNKKPDFLFPSAEAYHAGQQPLTMLAAKTTCKDRWRQILNEADRIPHKHLLTVQEGVSENQFQEMNEAEVQLVVPRSIHKKFPRSVRPNLMALEDFVAYVQHNSGR